MTSLLDSACVGGPLGSGGSSASPGEPGMIGEGLIVSITEEGGLVSPVELATRSPELAIYADGRMIQPVYLPTVYPGPLLPSLRQTMVTPADVQRVVDLAHTDGLADHDQNYVATGIADMADTVITVVGGKAVTSRFAALGAGGTVTDPTEAAARVGAEDFVTKLRGNPSFFGSDQLGAEQQYVPEALQIVAVQGNPSAGVQPSQMVRPPLAWPLAVPLSEFGASLPAGSPPTARCGVVSGTDLKLVWPLLQQATQITGFTSGSTTWTLTPRPLLPGEPSSCGSAHS